MELFLYVRHTDVALSSTYLSVASSELTDCTGEHTPAAISASRGTYACRVGPKTRRLCVQNASIDPLLFHFSFLVTLLYSDEARLASRALSAAQPIM